MQGVSDYSQIRRKILFEHLEKYKDASSHCIAKILHRDFPEFFKDNEDARGIVRRFRGASGNRHREVIKDNQYFKYEPT